MNLKFLVTLLICSVTLATIGQLTVSVGPSKVTGQRVVVPLALKNDFESRIESARAVVFLLDEHGKMAAQGTRWIIGGNRTNGLAPGGTNAFSFVLQAAAPPPTTNLTTKVSVNRGVLEGGRLVDIKKEVVVRPSGK